MKITFSVESDQKRYNIDADHFSRDEYLEKSGISADALKNLKDIGIIRYTAEAGGLQINRELLSMSREDLAEKSGIPVSLPEQYEESKEDINSAGLQTLLKICKAMDCRLPDILTDKETINDLRNFLEEK